MNEITTDKNLSQLIKDIKKYILNSFLESKKPVKTVNIASNDDKTEYYISFQVYNGKIEFIRISNSRHTDKTWEEWTTLKQTPKDKIYFITSIVLNGNDFYGSNRGRMSYVNPNTYWLFDNPYLLYHCNQKIYDVFNMSYDDLVEDISESILNMLNYKP